MTTRRIWGSVICSARIGEAQGRKAIKAIKGNQAMRNTAATTLAVCLLPALASPAVAGGFNEGGDAGRTIATAQPVSGGVGAVITISGSLSGPLFGPGDFEDVYKIFISNPTSFSVSTVGAAPFDTELFLFDPAGLGLLANDDTSVAVAQSTLPNAANDGTGAAVLLPGNYFLAITGKGNKPTSNGGQLIFDQPSATEVSGPDGPGAPFVQDDWTPGTGPIGAYTIQLTGVSFFPLEPIPSLSSWGLLLLTMALLTCGGLVFRGRRLRPA